MTDTRDREGGRSRGPTTRRRVLGSGAGLVGITGVAGVDHSSASLVSPESTTRRQVGRAAGPSRAATRRPLESTRRRTTPLQTCH
ncbi:hypothetical protein C496_11647 [Natronorubrum tibetense GA33]|uniref:Uncharacterized protein n=1 Tax=Natronorubrum tibetense GA33 TaxID=1114856 RepID=L9VT57_9EURY|nr:hypothetical protein C496_11647 [Natronorubrum tibetense GA33]